ncbi:uncharacterized protein LAESUDRAFT_652605 [Laetiporus sulphureus 93-53]|uniref:COX assembly mitochondrial protein n=1 Tax=Laetiporus sulphureus 93-53 TaxID=1314785 RepID=A0A165EDQ4_9APHY|nr:uncharacterized protein LAESUDRAFT_652605 [Laetiporus sulphureus 93-53]KZT06819.1 hypothetical protein LAESUDRAFT_652605 [Laetiporus sulphureus 93-53]
MDAISRREEDILLKTAKDKAMKECDPIVKEFAECAAGRTLSVAWNCKGKYRALQDCMVQ